MNEDKYKWIEEEFMLKNIVQSSFIEGWESLLMLLEDKYKLKMVDINQALLKAERCGSCQDYAEGFDKFPPILTEEIFDEIWKAATWGGLAIARRQINNPMEGLEIMVGERRNQLLKKYNLE